VCKVLPMAVDERTHVARCPHCDAPCNRGEACLPCQSIGRRLP
jgi:hypothetical protein